MRIVEAINGYINSYPEKIDSFIKGLRRAGYDAHPSRASMDRNVVACVQHYLTFNGRVVKADCDSFSAVGQVRVYDSRMNLSKPTEARIFYEGRTRSKGVSYVEADFELAVDIGFLEGKLVFMDSTFDSSDGYLFAARDLPDEGSGMLSSPRASVASESYRDALLGYLRNGVGLNEGQVFHIDVMDSQGKKLYHRNALDSIFCIDMG
jgi:hypothetical protein